MHTGTYPKQEQCRKPHTLCHSKSELAAVQTPFLAALHEQKQDREKPHTGDTFFRLQAVSAYPEHEQELAQEEYAK